MNYRRSHFSFLLVTLVLSTALPARAAVQKLRLIFDSRAVVECGGLMRAIQRNCEVNYSDLDVSKRAGISKKLASVLAQDPARYMLAVSSKKSGEPKQVRAIWDSANSTLITESGRVLETVKNDEEPQLQKCDDDGDRLCLYNVFKEGALAGVYVASSELSRIIEKQGLKYLWFVDSDRYIGATRLSLTELAYDDSL